MTQALLSNGKVVSSSKHRPSTPSSTCVVITVSVGLVMVDLLRSVSCCGVIQNSSSSLFSWIEIWWLLTFLVFFPSRISITFWLRVIFSVGDRRCFLLLATSIVQSTLRMSFWSRSFSIRTSSSFITFLMSLASLSKVLCLLSQTYEHVLISE